MEVRFVHLNTGKVTAKAEGKLEHSDRLTSAELLIPSLPLEFGEQGRYEFQVWANSMFLGSTTSTPSCERPNRRLSDGNNTP